MPRVRGIALTLGAGCVAAALVVGVLTNRADQQHSQTLDTQLRATAAEGVTVSAQAFERDRTINLVLSQDTALTAFAEDRRPLAAKMADRSGAITGVHSVLASLDLLLPGAVTSAGFALSNGQAVAGYTRGRFLVPHELTNVGKQAFFSGALLLGQDTVFRSDITTGTDGLPIITYATEVADWGIVQGVMYFSVSVSSLHDLLQPLSSAGTQLRLIDRADGSTLVDSASNTVAHKDASLSRRSLTGTSGTANLAGKRLAYAELGASASQPDLYPQSWAVVASSKEAVASGVLALSTAAALLLVGIAFLLLGLLLTLRRRRERRAQVLATQVERDRLAGRLSDLSGVLGRVASGDLAVTLPVDAGDDSVMRSLVVSFDDTIARLRILVASAQDNSDHLSRSAIELGVVAGQQADSATAQSAAVTETMVTIEELAATASQIAESAGGVSHAAREMLAITEEGRGAVERAVGAMERIAGRVESIATSTGSLEDKINEIGGILQLLDDLSDQTNLLALNAAIEAARAGQHGRGFSVFAAEVRKLAERAQESTGRIQSLVGEIHGLMHATVVATKDGGREVAAGTDLAHSAASALRRVADRVDTTTSTVQEISAATQQQRSASQQVVVAMTRLSDVSLMYAAGSRQAAASAAELATLAGTMHSSVDIFRVVERADDEDLLLEEVPPGR
jgi:methyl-accepting chemotaxis protein